MVGVEFISTVGFPIAAYILMYRMANKTVRENTQALQDLAKEVNNLE